MNVCYEMYLYVCVIYVNTIVPLLLCVISMYFKVQV